MESDSTAPTGIAGLLASKDTAPAPAPKSPPISPGRIVQYRLNEYDVRRISERRAAGKALGTHLTDAIPVHGNPVGVGDVVPMICTRVWPSDNGMCNGTALLDGEDTLWVTSAHEGTEPGCWAWPARG